MGSATATREGADAPDLSLVIPCFNEAGHLRSNVATIVEVLETTRLEWEIVFVDDGSEDGTREMLREICEGSPRLRAIFHERNRGRGAAFKTGFAATRGRVTGFLDVDLEVHALYIPALVNLVLHHGADVATGRRHYLLRQTGGIHRAILSHAYRVLCRFLLGFGIRDSETGCKFFRRETCAEVVLGSESDGWFWDTEVLSIAALKNLRIVEFPVLFLRRADKRSSVRLWRDSIRYLAELQRFRAKVGLSFLHKSPLYWTGIGYELAMRLLEGREYRSIPAAIAERIPPGSSVTEVCCGTGRLYREFLRARGCSYLGLDFNADFVMSARKRGVPVRFFDLLEEAVPPADFVVIGSSFYHFDRQREEIFAKLLDAARRALIVSEPVRNLSSARWRWLKRLANRLTNPGVGEFGFRFDLESFRAFAQTHGASEFVYEPGARNALAVFRKGETP
jgi:glycosyltransferase involved in cell wall biosynthesis